MVCPYYRFIMGGRLGNRVNITGWSIGQKSEYNMGGRLGKRVNIINDSDINTRIFEYLFFDTLRTKQYTW